MITLNLSYMPKDRYLQSGRGEVQTQIWMISETVLLISILYWHLQILTMPQLEYTKELC